jgi:hypothetical protein
MMYGSVGVRTADEREECSNVRLECAISLNFTYANTVPSQEWSMPVFWGVTPCILARSNRTFLRTGWTSGDARDLYMGYAWFESHPNTGSSH